jgi:soluble lytic murein transglycosylase-like protein
MKKYLIIFTCFSSFLAYSNEIIPLKSSFALSIALVESNNNPKAYNKHELAIGLYQIRLKYFLDAQKYDESLRKYTHIDCFNTNITLRVMTAYMNKYERIAIINNDFEILAKLHNGGPGWKKKTGQARANLQGYWQRIKHELAKQND